MTPVELRTEIRGVGLRATHQRIAVLGVLMKSQAPLSHDDVTQHLATGGNDRATIYRSLTTLARAGLLRRMSLGDRVWRFEYARRAPHAQAHPHFSCTSCGRVECVPELEVVADRVKSPRAIKQGQIEVQVRGLCDACARKRRA
ncbi:MAG TPA: Fur family transcriptional regulator [Kofleriaceae bacterium]